MRNIIIILITYVAFSQASHATDFAFNTDELIKDAKELCIQVQLEGLTEKSGLKAQAQFSLATIIRKIGIDLGLDARAAKTKEKYKSVKQSHLSNTIEHVNKCNIEAFKMLVDVSFELQHYKINSQTKPKENPCNVPWQQQPSYCN